MSSVVELKFFAIISGIKKYKPIIKKKRKKDDEILLVKIKLNAMVVLISKTLIDSFFSHNEFVSVNVLREYDNMKKAIKNLKTSTVHQRFYSICKTILLYWLKSRKRGMK